MKVWVIIGILLGLLVGHVQAGSPSAPTTQRSDAQAAIEDLNVENARLWGENEELRNRIAELEGKRPTSAPVRKYNKVIFVSYAPTPDYAEVATIGQSINDLQADQSFNLFIPYRDGVDALQKGFFVLATPENKRRAGKLLARHRFYEGHLEDALKAAINYRPDLICVATKGEVKEMEATLKMLRQANGAHPIPIDTCLKFSPSVQMQHFLWQLSKESGGVCLDEKNQPADEPVLPVKAVEPTQTPAPAKPGIFRVH